MKMPIWGALAIVLQPIGAWAQIPAPQTAPQGPQARGTTLASAHTPPPSGCTDTWPQDRKRPQLVEKFPTKAISGHLALLQLEITHLPGEKVFPAGLSLAPDSDEVALLKAASFQILDPASATKPALETHLSEKQATTTVNLPLLPLPPEAGRSTLTLPPLPVSIARASGQVHTLCTQAHVLVVEDVLASEANPQQKPDPEPRPQREVWTSLRDILGGLLLAIPLAALLAWLFLRLRKKFKKVPLPPPPRPPWERALEQLAALESRGLVASEKFDTFLDGVSDILREYLGERYGFDGLESTTRELLRQLKRRAPQFTEKSVVKKILQRADLVKFAQRLPSEDECRDAFAQTKKLVRDTVHLRVAPPPSSPPQRMPKETQAEEANFSGPTPKSKGGDS